MIVNIFRAVWFVSLLAVVANLLYIYAGLPENVIIRELDLSSFSISRETLFYGWAGVIGLVNVLVYLFSKRLTPDEGFRIWLTGLVVTLNAFFIIALSFIGLYNSNENFDFSRAGVVLYLSVGLVAMWLTSWPVVLMVRRLYPKP